MNFPHHPVIRNEDRIRPFGVGRPFGFGFGRRRFYGGFGIPFLGGLALGSLIGGGFGYPYPYYPYYPPYPYPYGYWY